MKWQISNDTSLVGLEVNCRSPAHEAGALPTGLSRLVYAKIQCLLCEIALNWLHGSKYFIGFIYFYMNEYIIQDLIVDIGDRPGTSMAKLVWQRLNETLYKALYHHYRSILRSLGSPD